MFDEIIASGGKEGFHGLSMYLTAMFDTINCHSSGIVINYRTARDMFQLAKKNPHLATSFYNKIISSGVYNNDMARKLRLLLAILILTISLALLLWGLWPNLVETRILPVDPGQMQLPTPVSFYLGSVG